MIVLDSSALLALLNNETGATLVEERITEGATMSVVNYAEVVAKLSEFGIPAEDIRETLNGLNISLEDFDEAQAFASGLLRPATKVRGLSLGDRACLVLASHLNLPVLTADRNWVGLMPGVTLEWVR